eukprot:370971-Rhodomonas_salina.2
MRSQADWIGKLVYCNLSCHDSDLHLTLHLAPDVCQTFKENPGIKLGLKASFHATIVLDRIGLRADRPKLFTPHGLDCRFQKLKVYINKAHEEIHLILKQFVESYYNCASQKRHWDVALLQLYALQNKLQLFELVADFVKQARRNSIKLEHYLFSGYAERGNIITVVQEWRKTFTLLFSFPKGKYSTREIRLLHHVRSYSLQIKLLSQLKQIECNVETIVTFNQCEAPALGLTEE